MKKLLLGTISMLLLSTLVAAQSQSMLRVEQLKGGMNRATVFAGMAENYILNKLVGDSDDFEMWDWQAKAPTGSGGSSGTLAFSKGKLVSVVIRLSDYKREGSDLAKRMYSELYLATDPRTDGAAARVGQREATAHITVRDDHSPGMDQELLFIEIPNRQMELRLTIENSSVELDRIKMFE